MYDPANVCGPLHFPLPRGCEQTVYGRGRTSVIVLQTVNGDSRVPQADPEQHKIHKTFEKMNGWGGNYITLIALFTFRLGWD